MKRSLSYKLVLLVLKMKGVKKTFCQSPIDYLQLRKEDVKHPEGRFYKKHMTNQFNVLETVVTEISASNPSKRLVIYIHGGAFVSGPTQHHWDSIKKIHQETNQTIWLCDYPKAPETKITEIAKNINEVYQSALKKYDANAITLIGDSVGGTLVIGLIQNLIKTKKIAQPEKIILISPVLDASLPDPQSLQIDSTDPMLSAAGFLSAKSMCAENNNLKAANLSPIYGEFKSFPKTIMYLAEDDITYPDQLKMVEQLHQNKVEVEVITGKGMPHIWPLLPVMSEAKLALEDIIQKIKS